MLKLSNEQREVIAEAVRYSFIDNRTDKNLLVRLHREVFNSELCLTCEHEHIRAYIELYRLINPKSTSMNPPSKKYRFNPLRENERLSLKGMRGVVTADTLTDDVANLLIKKGTYGDLIVTVEEAKAITAKIEADSKVDYSKHKVSELKLILDSAGVDYSEAKLKADFVSLAESI